MKKGKNTKIKNRVKELIEKPLTLDEKFRECFKKLNIKNQPITVADLIELRDLLPPQTSYKESL